MTRAARDGPKPGAWYSGITWSLPGSASASWNRAELELEPRDGTTGEAPSVAPYSRCRTPARSALKALPLPVWDIHGHGAAGQGREPATWKQPREAVKPALNSARLAMRPSTTRASYEISLCLGFPFRKGEILNSVSYSR